MINCFAPTSSIHYDLALLTFSSCLWPYHRSLSNTILDILISSILITRPNYYESFPFIISFTIQSSAYPEACFLSCYVLQHFLLLSKISSLSSAVWTYFVLVHVSVPMTIHFILHWFALSLTFHRHIVALALELSNWLVMLEKVKKRGI